MQHHHQPALAFGILQVGGDRHLPAGNGFNWIKEHVVLCRVETAALLGAVRELQFLI
jgi:hypothetical protein